MSKKPHKILFVSLFPPRVGGLPLQSELLAHYLREEGVEVLKVNAHHEDIGKSLAGKGRKAWLQVASVIQACKRGAKEVDQIIAAGCSWWGFMPVAVALLVGHACGKPVTVLYHGGAARQFLRMHHPWVRRILRMADAVAVTSDFLRKEFAVYGIETTVVPPILRSESHHSRRRGLVLLSTRYLEPIYDVGTILEAFVGIQAIYPRARLVVAGSGSQRQMLQDFARRHGLRVTFTGHLPPDELGRTLGEASFFINAARVDNLPLSVLEAMYAGAVVITTPVGELPRLIVHGTHGLFFVPGDAESLAHTVLYALRNEKVVERCRQYGRRLAASFTWDHVRGPYMRLLHLDGARMQRCEGKGTLERE